MGPLEMGCRQHSVGARAHTAEEGREQGCAKTGAQGPQKEGVPKDREGLGPEWGRLDGPAEQFGFFSLGTWEPLKLPE